MVCQFGIHNIVPCKFVFCNVYPFEAGAKCDKVLYVCMYNKYTSNNHLNSLQVNISLSVFLLSVAFFVLILERTVMCCAHLEWVDFRSKSIGTVGVGGYSCVVGSVVGRKLGFSSQMWVDFH